MYILARLNLNGQCISVAKEYEDIKVGVHTAPFKIALDKKKASGKAVKAAMTFPGGTHDLWIRYWLAAGGTDPDKDIETIVVPPPQMVANMKVGTMDCFCVCEPWNLQLIHQQIGYTAITTGELWNKHPEKSFGLRASFVDKYPRRRWLAQVRDGAQQWCDKPENRDEVAAICAKRQWINCPVEDVTDRVKGKFDYGIPGKVVRTARTSCAIGRITPVSVPESRSLVPHRRYPLGKYEAGFDTKGLIARSTAKIFGATQPRRSTSQPPISRPRNLAARKPFRRKVFDPEIPALTSRASTSRGSRLMFRAACAAPAAIRNTGEFAQ
jgi:nitrate/nitrite transport system substrate-binding protein